MICRAMCLTTARLEAEYDTLLTNRLILQGQAGAELYGKDDERPSPCRWSAAADPPRRSRSTGSSSATAFDLGAHADARGSSASIYRKGD